jgi:competence ComEA-like helix-hairpin-helix protein
VIARLLCSIVVALLVAAPAAAECVNINTASFEELQRIVHIGPDRASEIIRLRPFASVDSLERVTGIGSSRLADIKAQGVACARELIGDSLCVQLSSGDIATLRSSDLVYVRDEWRHIGATTTATARMPVKRC